MPIYEYRCDACKERIEVMQRFSDPPLAECKCGGRLRKVLSPPAIIFKGSGWHITDYARKDKADGNGGNGGEQKAEGEKSGTSEAATKE